MNTAILLIDYQNDYFPEADGKYPLWNTKEVTEKTLDLIDFAQDNYLDLFLIQHIGAENDRFFCKGTIGAEIYWAFQTYDIPVIKKTFTSSFKETDLEQYLRASNIERIVLTGMMTHNCVGHTAIADEAQKYRPIIISDCCTSREQIIHEIALGTASQEGVSIVSLADFMQSQP